MNEKTRQGQNTKQKETTHGTRAPMFQVLDMGVSKNRGTPKSSILIGFSIIFTIHFGVALFLETPIYKYCFDIDTKRLELTL